MERYFQRESVLLGYSPQNSFRDHTTSPETQSDDIDFNDVFGGPPRRSSAQETRLSFNETADYSGFGDDDEISSRDSWKGLSEKPVFGDEGLRRRRYASDNFFHDIFKGKDSLSSSPRKREWDLVSSSPSSRVLSPSRPLPAKADPIGSPLPAPFSLPAKLTKAVELPTFGSTAEVPHGSKDSAPNVTSHDSSSPQSRSSSPKQSRKNKNDTRTSYRQSLLSREISLSSNESANVSKDNEMKESHCPEPPKNSNQFHFSIYKWASNGIPLVMPLKGGNGSKLKENSHSISEKSSKFNIKKPVTDDHKPSNGSIPDISTQDDEPWQIVDHADVVSPSLGEKTKTSSLSQTGLRGTLEEKVSETTEEAHKPEVKPLYSFFYDNNYKISGNEKISKSSEKGGTVKSSTEKSSTVPDFFKNLKKQDVKRSGSGCVEAAKGGLGGSALNSGDPGKTRSKGKVKEFVKIFNEETSSKPKIGSDTHSQSSRSKESDTSKEEKEVNFNKKGAEEKVDLHNMHEKKSPADASIGGNKNTQKRERQQPDMKNAPSPNGFRATFGDRRESLQDFEIKDLTQAENDQPKAGNDSDETQAIDAKIRKWSNGKEGNIRSLLSTLQYVLWPGSGWKPVPLVDIIEGSAVKRSYQKALLCLHPDKLQQKGAASHQKYIAEKVFDLLQDAWDHFNSLGT